MSQTRRLLLLSLSLFLLLAACNGPAAPVAATITAESGALAGAAVLSTAKAATAATATVMPSATTPPDPPTLTPQPTSTATPSPAATATPTATATATATATPIGACDGRVPADGLLALVTAQFGLSRDFVPDGLVNLSDYFDSTITLGYPTQIRDIIAAPLRQMVDAMHADGLSPWIISGYRSYSAQAVAYDKWSNQYDYAGAISAAPGHSEHQLGTTVDFGSPNLPDYTGDPDLQFHTYFYMTPEGEWLLANAPGYGFTLSYPREAFDLTGFYYEPWHYRYVGVELAMALQNEGITFTEYILAEEGEPCIP